MVEIQKMESNQIPSDEHTILTPLLDCGWTTQFACLLTKVILEFGCCCNIILHIVIMLPNSDSFLELSTMLSTTSLQSSSICTFDRPKLSSHKIASLKPNTSASLEMERPHTLGCAFMK